MKMLAIALVLALLLAACGSVATVVNGDYDAETTTEETETTTEATTRPSPVTIDGLVWRVPPMLPHQRIDVCCGFMDEQWRYIDSDTGLLTGEVHGGHGVGGGGFVYDSTLGLFGQGGFGGEYTMLYGMFPVNGFEESVHAMFAQLAQDWDWINVDESVESFVRDATTRQIIPRVDSARRNNLAYPIGGTQTWFLTQEAYTGEFAVFENLARITPWYDGIRPAWEWQWLAVLQNDTWMIVDFEGRPLLPIQFANFWFICDDTAFARLPNGLYGILDITATYGLYTTERS